MPDNAHTCEIDDTLIDRIAARMRRDGVGEAVRINAPEFFRDQEFIDWLNDPVNCIATWHAQGQVVGECADIFMTFDVGDGYGEGSNSDMPEHIWNAICRLVEQHCGPRAFGLIWLSNVEVDDGE